MTMALMSMATVLGDPARRAALGAADPEVFWLDEPIR
jgi:hypothetical protein